jgi:hypothetical protein
VLGEQGALGCSQAGVSSRLRFVCLLGPVVLFCCMAEGAWLAGICWQSLCSTWSCGPSGPSRPCKGSCACSCCAYQHCMRCNLSLLPSEQVQYMYMRNSYCSYDGPTCIWNIRLR